MASQVWMRPHSQVAAQKLWGVINEPLEAGTNLTIAVRLWLHSSLAEQPCFARVHLPPLRL